MAIVNLEDSLLDRLAVNPSAIQLIPFLKPLGDALRKQNKGCGQCGSSSHDPSHLRNLIKTHLVNTANTTTTVYLKNFLGASQIRFFYSDGTVVKEALL
jgi:hypothetical protein